MLRNWVNVGDGVGVGSGRDVARRVSNTETQMEMVGGGGGSGGQQSTLCSRLHRSGLLQQQFPLC